jgi:heme exporter protein B
MWHDALLVAAKDLRIERRSQVGLRQIMPFALTLIVVFAFALDTLVVRDPNLADARTSGVPVSLVAPGLIWVGVLLCAVLTIQRSAAIESAEGARDALRLSGMDPGAVFLGKAMAILVQLVAVLAVLGAGAVLFYDATLRSWPLLGASAILALTSLAATGSLYGALAAGTSVRDTLLPMLFLPAVLPVLLAAVRAWQSALDGRPNEGWPWVRLLLAVAVVAVGVGLTAYGALVED